MKPFCMSKTGALIGCDAPDEAEPMPISAASSHDQTQGVQVNTAYTSLDFHPTTLFLSGVGTLLILGLILTCYCGAKRFLKVTRGHHGHRGHNHGNNPLPHKSQSDW